MLVLRHCACGNHPFTTVFRDTIEVVVPPLVARKIFFYNKPYCTAVRLPHAQKRHLLKAQRGGFITAIQAEAGFACPTTMTYAAIPALRMQPELAAAVEDGIGHG